MVVWEVHVYKGGVGVWDGHVVYSTQPQDDGQIAGVSCQLTPIV